MEEGSARSHPAAFDQEEWWIRKDSLQVCHLIRMTFLHFRNLPLSVVVGGGGGLLLHLG